MGSTGRVGHVIAIALRSNRREDPHPYPLAGRVDLGGGYGHLAEAVRQPQRTRQLG